MLKKIQQLMFSIFLLTGLMTGFNSLHGLYLSYQSTAWKTTQGTITSLKFSSRSSPKGASASARHIKYSYEVGNQIYIGDREYFGLQIATNGETSAGYYEGTRIKVYYNPSDPANAVLKPNSRRAIWFGLTLALVFGSFGGMGYIK